MTMGFSYAVGVQPPPPSLGKAKKESNMKCLKKQRAQAPSATMNMSFSTDQRSQSVSFALDSSKLGNNRDRTYSAATVASSTYVTSIAEEVSEQGTTMPEYFASRLTAQITRRVEMFLAKSAFIEQNSNIEDIPRFSREDLNLGEVIAKGGFSAIVEVNSFHRNPLSESSDQRFVIKHLNPALPLKKLPGGGKDLAFEARTLSALNHRNIIKLRGWSEDGLDGFKNTLRADGFFIVLDRMGETLFQRIYKWQHEARSRRNASTLKRSQPRSHRNIQQDLFREKMQVGVDVSSALAYCHSKGIMHRDLKSANVCFDPRDGSAKLIDFGLAVELVPHNNPNHTYDLAGNIGTARYMSPEVIQQKRYNMKADVFSFAVLLWECLAAAKPYADHDAECVKERVSEWGERPKPFWSWPGRIKRTMKKGWSKNHQDRPTMAEVHNELVMALEKLNH